MKNNNPAAFPVAMSEQTFSNQESAPWQEGMTLRDYFAAKIIQGILVNNPLLPLQSSYYTGTAYDIADAMLTEREKSKS